MYARLPDQVQRARLCDHAARAQGLGQYLQQSLRVRCAGNLVVRTTCASNVRSFISDQFSEIGTENAKFESRPFTTEKDILLTNRGGGAVTQTSRNSLYCDPIPESGLNLNVGGHTLIQRIVYTSRARQADWK